MSVGGWHAHKPGVPMCKPGNPICDCVHSYVFVNERRVIFIMRELFSRFGETEFMWRYRE